MLPRSYSNSAKLSEPFRQASSFPSDRAEGARLFENRARLRRDRPSIRWRRRGTAKSATAAAASRPREAAVQLPWPARRTARGDRRAAPAAATGSAACRTGLLRLRHLVAGAERIARKLSAARAEPHVRESCRQAAQQLRAQTGFRRRQSREHRFVPADNFRTADQTRIERRESCFHA